LEGVRAIDLSQCPTEFADAYRRYLKGWEHFKAAVPNNKCDTVTVAKAIDILWGDVEAVARRHGAAE
jgi:hypothetical protein